MESTHQWISASAAIFIPVSAPRRAKRTADRVRRLRRSALPTAPVSSASFRPADLPKPGATASASIVLAWCLGRGRRHLQVPDGFKIELFAEGLSGPRQMRVAPNGDVFVAETSAGRIRVLRPGKDGAKPVVKRNLCRQSRQAVRNCVLPERRQAEMGLYRQYRQRRSLSLSRGRHQGRRQAGDDRAPSSRMATGIRPATSSLRETTSRCSSRSARLATTAKGMGSPPGGTASVDRASTRLAPASGDETDRAGVLAFDPDGRTRAFSRPASAIASASRPSRNRRPLLLDQ